MDGWWSSASTCERVIDRTGLAGFRPQEVKRYQHPEVGRLELHSQQLLDPLQSHRLMVYAAEPGSESHEKGQMLAVIGAQSLSVT